ncbi:MAG: DUF151 domain-containing protein [Cytophagales bacterium]|nr:DUF151 domain-containing protein [Cytophagales bacterium]
MEKIKLDILGLSSSQSQSGSFALVLGEVDGKRRLPIIIGMFEAQAIAIEIEKIVPNRPMTHDLFKSFAEGYDFKVLEVYISQLNEGVFYAKLICSKGNGVVEIDARPSDAIAIGLRFGAEIYTSESILNEAGIVLEDEKEEEDRPARNVELASKVEIEKSSKVQEESFRNVSTQKLNEMLEEAIRREDYEMAARLRDEINRRS